jgi:hypothetical protein
MPPPLAVHHHIERHPLFSNRFIDAGNPAARTGRYRDAPGIGCLSQATCKNGVLPASEEKEV